MLCQEWNDLDQTGAIILRDLIFVTAHTDDEVNVITISNFCDTIQKFSGLGGIDHTSIL